MTSTPPPPSFSERLIRRLFVEGPIERTPAERRAAELRSSCYWSRRTAWCDVRPARFLSLTPFAARLCKGLGVVTLAAVGVVILLPANSPPPVLGRSMPRVTQATPIPEEQVKLSAATVQVEPSVPPAVERVRRIEPAAAAVSNEPTAVSFKQAAPLPRLEVVEPLVAVSRQPLAVSPEPSTTSESVAVTEPAVLPVPDPRSPIPDPEPDLLTPPLAMVTPRVETRQPLYSAVEPLAGRRVVYLVDISGSQVDVYPEPTTWLADHLRELNERDRFEVIFFRDSELFETPPLGMTDATAQSKQQVRQWIDPAAGNIRIAGRADLLTALEVALGFDEVTDIYVLADDQVMPTDAAYDETFLVSQVLDVVEQRPGLRVHGVQFFYRDDAGTLEALADCTGGGYTFIGGDETYTKLPAPLEPGLSLSAYHAEE